MCPSFKFQLFGFLDLYTIFMLVGVIACMIMARVLADHRKMKAKWQNLVLFDALASVVLGYGSAVLFQAFYNFMEDGTFEITSHTGATFYGGLIGGAVVFIAVYFVAGRFLFPDGYHKKHFMDVVDMGAPCIAVAHGFGRLGCLMAGCCHGPVVSSHEFGIRMWDGTNWATRMPVQLFEAVFLFLLCAFLFFLYWEKSKGIMAYYMIFYGGWRIVAEMIRTDDRGATFVEALTPSQLISILMILGGIVMLLVGRRRKKAVTIAETPAQTENAPAASVSDEVADESVTHDQIDG